MLELSKYVGPTQDIPTLGMGVGERELGYIEGQFKRIKGCGAFMKSPSKLSANATGFGVVHFADAMLKAKNISLEGKVSVNYA